MQLNRHPDLSLKGNSIVLSCKLERLFLTSCYLRAGFSNNGQLNMYIKIESMRLDWYSNPENQKLIRAELYQGVVDVLSAGETHASKVGKRIVLPRTFQGGDRNMQQRFLNAMAIVQRFGKPGYFITMTCNPYWEEITSNLEPAQTPQDRPELVARVYRAKLRDMKDLLMKKKYLFLDGKGINFMRDWNGIQLPPIYTPKAMRPPTQKGPELLLWLQRDAPREKNPHTPHATCRLHQR